MKRSEAIKNFLKLKTHPDLADLYNDSMEVQVNVAIENGHRVDYDYKGKPFHCYEDDMGNRWSSFRLPRDAKTDPSDNDSEMTFDLMRYVEGVGCSGFDWKNRKSIYVGYDFDALTGHSEKHAKKLTNQELEQVKEAVEAIPWVTLRKSTSGKGLHVYVFLDSKIETKNHVEHSAIARSILGLMSSITGFDFKAKVDSMGAILWFWHRKMIGTDGLSLLKKGDYLTEIPPNWRDHIRVVNGSGRKTIPSFINDSSTNPALRDMFEEVAASKSRIPLDEDHQKLIKFLHDNKSMCWYDSDHHMVVTHTIHLKEAHDKLKLKGIFKTVSTGKDYGADINCFMFPLRQGAWVVRRYTLGVAEESTWTQDSQGYTKCYFNKDLDMHTACRAYSGTEHPTGGYIFKEGKVASQAANLLGINLNLPSWAHERKTKIKERKDGRFDVSFDRAELVDPINEMPDWVPEKKSWTRIFTGTKTTNPEPEIGNYDEIVRHVISSTNSDLGWVIRSEKQWREEPRVHIKDFLKGTCSLKEAEVQAVMGNAIAKPWQIVCRPFEDEYPKSTEGREWNRRAPQLRFKPTNSDTLIYPTWLKILNHLGKSLDDSIKKNEWAKVNGILTGADYLKVWVASLIQEPMQPLPYLFFYGPQDSGKSIFHEAIGECLISSGVVRADNALTNQQGFNGELENALIAAIEETDMRNSKVAYQRIKDWTTARELPIHPKNKTPYTIINTLHFIQTANDYMACPIMEGDTRVVVAFVDELPPTEKIPKKLLLQTLEKEAPDFIAELLNLELPQCNDRLNIPVITTEEKIKATQSNKNLLEQFIEDQCYYVPGDSLPYGDFYDKFLEWIPRGQVNYWPKRKVGLELPKKFPKGRGTNNVVMIGNISFSDKESTKKPLICLDDRLVVDND